MQKDIVKLLSQLLFRQARRGKAPKTWIGFLFLAVLAIVMTRFAPDYFPASQQQTVSSSSQEQEWGEVRVKRCVDGDTLLLEGGVRVRFIGANTPETKKPNWPIEPFGPEASAFTQRTIENAGNRVRLEADGDRFDRYGRQLALVYVGDTLLNEELIRQGLARAETQYRYSSEMKAKFQAAEYEAQKAQRGIWSVQP